MSPETPIDQFRMRSLQRTTSVNTIRRTWPFFEKKIREILGPDPDGEAVFRLGESLSDVFRSVPKKVVRQVAEEAPEDDAFLGERTQSDVSAGGIAWEILVAWYLNLVCYGTDVLATRRNKTNTPAVITDAVCVTLHGHSTTTESDVVVYTTTGVRPSGKTLSVRDLDRHIRADTQSCTVAIVQCKTNWNDNAQIPMLWDLIYRSLPFVQVSTMRLGRNGVTPRSFKGESVKYAFMTVPTNDKRDHKPSSVSVTRVLGLSGGNYWGRPTKPGVATAFSEFLGTNFSGDFDGSIQNHLDRQIAARPDLIERFLRLDFSGMIDLDVNPLLVMELPE